MQSGTCFVLWEPTQLSCLAMLQLLSLLSLNSCATCSSVAGGLCSRCSTNPVRHGFLLSHLTIRWYLQRLPWNPFHKGSSQDSVLAKTGLLQHTQSYLGLEWLAAWQINLMCFPVQPPMNAVCSLGCCSALLTLPCIPSLMTAQLIHCSHLCIPLDAASDSGFYIPICIL